uniref:CCHC-type domain-containing protein n=1 Tax=Oryza glumipatula TaxID=40148 RepID=A0A0D9YP52_9ORYZ
MAPQPTCQTCVRNYLGSKEDPALSENPNQLAEQVTNQVAKTDNTAPGPINEVATRNPHLSMDIYQILANQTQILQEIAQNLASIHQQLLLPQPKVNPDKSKDKAAEIQGTQSVEGTDTNKEKNIEFLNVMITGMKTPPQAHDCPNFQKSIDKSLLQENNTVKEGSGHKRKTSPSEVDMQDVPQCQTMQPCQHIPKYPTLKSKKIRHVPGLICFICHEIGHYMRHCPQKPYMDALLQANMSTSRMPFYPQGSPNSQNVNTCQNLVSKSQRSIVIAMKEATPYHALYLQQDVGRRQELNATYVTKWDTTHGNAAGIPMPQWYNRMSPPGHLFKGTKKHQTMVPPR